jgi:hypothetical protein
MIFEMSEDIFEGKNGMTKMIFSAERTNQTLRFTISIKADIVQVFSMILSIASEVRYFDSLHLNL